MRLALVYDPQCPKLKPDAYSQCYLDQFKALHRAFPGHCHVTADCSAQDIDADVIIFYDIHSSHHIKIEGIEKHQSLKYEYFNDPWQENFKGQYRDGTPVHKLGPKERTERALRRGVRYIICPYENLYHRFIAPHGKGLELVWFPIAPDKERFKVHPDLTERKPKVLWNGATWDGQLGFHPYHMRRWAYGRKGITKAEHNVVNDKTPGGQDYPNFLAEYAGVLALCDTHICPKYSEIPLARCVTFAQELYDYAKMGFEDGVNCVYVTRGNFDRKVEDFKADVSAYQGIADRGRELMEKWTADKFANYIYRHAEQHGN